MKSVGRRLDVKRNQNVYAVAVAIALLLAAVLLVTFYIQDRPPTNPYASISILDTNHKAENYPEFLVTGVNSTFSLYVDVDNQMGGPLNGAEVLVKATNETVSTFPIGVPAMQTLTFNVANGQTWEGVATVSLNEPGNYTVSFELWIPNQSPGALEFSGNYCLLNIRVASQNVAT